MFCYKCGSKIDDDAKFCRHCGAKMNMNSTVESTAPISEINADEKQFCMKTVKKNFSKGLILGLVGVVVFVVVLVSVLGDNQEPYYSPNSTVSTTETEKQTGDVTIESEESNMTEQNDIDKETDGAKEDVVIETIHFSTENMRPTVLETSDIRVRFNKFSYANSKTVFGVNFTVENETDEEISVVLTDVTVNGYDVSTSTGKTLVEPGHKAICDSSLWQKEIDETGESKWDSIEGVIEVREGYWGDVLYSIPVIIDKSCWEYEEEYAENNPITPIVSSDLTEIPEGAIIISSENLYPVLFENDGVKAAVSAYGYANGKTVFEIDFTFENNTDKDLNIVLTDVIIDGYDISSSTGKTLVEAGHKAVCDSSVWLRDMKEVGINDWIVLKGTVEIREGYLGDALYSIPVVIYRNAWTSTN